MIMASKNDTSLHDFYGITIPRVRSDDRYDTRNMSHVIQIILTTFGVNAARFTFSSP